MSHLYLHVPFCSSICYYCDFKRNIYNEEVVNAWLKAINNECRNKIKEHNLKTIYLGGGTPSCLNYSQLDCLLSILDKYVDGIVEYTIESNIESLDEKKVEIMKRHGINRISLGVQSLNDTLLKDMNRKHTKDDVIKMLDNLHKWGMKNISVDFIYGFENQSLSIWENDLNEIVKNPHVTHLSLYSLTIEENSVFYKQNKRNCSNELEALMYERAISILEENGFIQYEVANFAKLGYESIHNQAYWKYDDFYGIGVGASGKSKNIRYTNDGTISEYINGQHLVEEEVLSKEDMMFENVMMSLRMRKGLNIDTFNERYDVSFLEHYHDAVQKSLKHHDLIIDGNYIKVSNQGMFYLHDILIRFMK